MPNQPQAQSTGSLQGDLLNLLAQHGVQGLPQTTVTGGQTLTPGGQAAGAYITSIITGDQAFDANVLHQVVSTLSQGTIAASSGGGG